MISQFAKRPQSSHRSTLRPVTGKVTEASKKQSDQFFQQGKKHMNKKQYDQALKHYMNATFHNPANYKALCNMGTIYKQIGKFHQAKNCYVKALFSYANDYVSLYNLANLQRISGNDEAAIPLYGKMLKLKQKENMDIGGLYFDSLINLGICYKNIQLYDQAIQCFQKALLTNSNDISAYFNKAMSQLKKIYSLNKLGFQSVRKKLCKQTITAFQKVLSIDQNNFTAKVALIQLKYLEEMSQLTLTNGVSQLQSALKTAPQPHKFQIQVKLRYCENQLKKIKDKKVVPPPLPKTPKANSVQEKNQQQKKINKYDQQASKKSQSNKEQISKQPIQKQSEKPIKKQKQPEPVKEKKKQQPKPQQKPNKQIVKQVPKFNPEIQAKLKSGKSLTEIINQLIDQKKYDEAFELAKQLPDGKQKYELEIIINFLQSQQTENDAILDSALSIYQEYIIKNNPDTPITKQTCSQKGHQIMATMLNIAQNYLQASKHYEALLKLLQDQKFGNKQQQKQKVQQIHADLGVCYAQRGLRAQAIDQYRISYQMQPDNYFLMTNLGVLLIENGQKQQAKSLYQKYLKAKGEQNMQDKVSYVDCLLNISICENGTQVQEQSIKKTIEAIQKHFPSYQQVKKNLHEQAILDVYLRYIDFLEKKLEDPNKTEQQQKQVYDQMLDVYLSCLQFPACPDRQSISLNAGIIFYLSGCYANALAFYNSVTMNKKLAANNMGLALLHLQQYEKALGYLLYSNGQNPNNIIYATNLEIAKWICGASQKQFIQKYKCKCQSMFEIRVEMGLWMIDELTKMIDSEEIKLNDQNKNSQTAEEVKSLLQKLINKSQKPDRRKVSENNKIKYNCEILEQHMSQSHKNDSQVQKTKVPAQIVNISFKKCSDVKQFEENFNKISEYLQKLNKNTDQYSIIQAIIALFLISNSHLLNQNQNIKQKLLKQSLHYSSKNSQNLKISYTKQLDLPPLAKSIHINYPTVQLKLKLIHNLVKDQQCTIQNTAQYLIQHIQNVYYSNIKNILWPLIRQSLYPHCDNSEECQRCITNSLSFYTCLFDKKMTEGEIQINQNWSAKKQIQSFPKAIENFVEKCMFDEQNKVFSKANKTLTFTINQKTLPFRIKTHHKSFDDVCQFLKSIDENFKINAGSQNQQKGVRTIQINNLLVLELYWGQNLTVFEKFWYQFSKRESNIIHDALLLIGSNLEEVDQIFSSVDGSPAKIRQLLKIK